MLVIKQNQIAVLNNKALLTFSKRMQTSLTKNLEADFTNKLEDIYKAVNIAISRYGINKETNLEDFLLIYYSYPEVKDMSDEYVRQILLNNDKTEEIKIEEISSYSTTLKRI